MKRVTKSVMIVLIALFAVNQVRAQVDPHFSQYYVYPSWLNPAMTGVFDGDVRVAGIYRNQWGNISSPYSTPGLSADFNTNKNAAFGVSVLQQKAGDGGFAYTTAYGSMAYSGIKFGPQGYKRISLGFELGLIQRKFDPSKLKFGNQWNSNVGFDPSMASNEPFARTKASSFDVGVGALYFDGEPGKNANLFVGASVAHLTRPTDKLSAQGEDAKLPIRYTGHAGVRIKISDVASITPNALYMKQGSAEEKMIGAYLQMKAATDADFMIGVNYRVKDAVSPYVGFTYKGMVLGASYDVNTSDLGKVAKGTNGFELSLTYIFKKSAKTPETEFICPRL